MLPVYEHHNVCCGSLWMAKTTPLGADKVTHVEAGETFCESQKPTRCGISIRVVDADQRKLPSARSRGERGGACIEGRRPPYAAQAQGEVRSSSRSGGSGETVSVAERSADARRRTVSRLVGVPGDDHSSRTTLSSLPPSPLGDRITAATMTTMLSSSPPLRKIVTPRS